jgi:DNA-binding GntR family transcriptional regulator
MVPSELALAEQHSVSRGTARSALALLVDEGLVEVVSGQGRRVVGTAAGRLPATEWGRVAATLRERLEAGEFAASMAMPSEAALVAEFGVSRNTVRRAYKHLVDTGVVVVRHGVGAFPAPR